ncbi:MAG TPA: HDOD domain-containing protein [Deltaproteobacteria bacterium]|nr:HDOD domain-containing protein [Deltaproteobacteria bacterium]
MRSNIVEAQSIPVLPELADQVIRMALDDEVSIVRMSSLIEKDQALTARILHLANSSAYGLSRSVYTVRDAITVVGFDAVRTLALGVSVLGLFPGRKGHELDYKAFWRHSIGCALFAEALAGAVKSPSAAKAFCTGVLHDIGKIILDMTRPEEYAAVLKEAQESSRPLVDIEREMLATTHCEVAREVIAHWKLPRLYEEGIWCHHAPVKILDDEQHQISWVLHIANILTHMTCIGSSGNHFPQRITNPLLKRFGIEPETLDVLVEKVPRQIDALCEELGIGKPAEGLFGMINKANMKLVDISMKLQQNTSEVQKARRHSDTLIELFTDLNTSSRISDALEKAASRLLGAGLIRTFLAGLQMGTHNLVYEASKEGSPRFVKVGGEELKAMILSNHALVGMRLSSGVFVYFEPETREMGEDHKFLSTVIGAVSSALRRLYMESTMTEEKDGLRKALQSAAEEKHRAEDSLLLNEEIMNASSYGLCLLDETNSVRLENASSQAIRKHLAISGRNLLQVLSEDTQQASQELKNAIVSRTEAGILWTGHDRSFKVGTRPIRVNNWTLITFSDITDELDEERRRVAYARMSVVGSLAASMAHNMKSPLGAIHGFGSIIKDDVGSGRIRVLRDGQDDPDFMDMINNIITGSENLLKIVNQLLTFTRKWESPVGEIDVDGFLEGIFQIVSPQASSAGVTLSRSIETGTAHIKADAIEQVLINLLINAIKASSQGSEVTVRAWRNDGGVEFSVADTGIGMDQSQLPKIFDPLYTAWPVKTGMGLGLSLARDIVDSMGGRIEVTSSPGEGSTFAVWIPEGKG